MPDHLIITGGGQAAAQAAISLRGAGYDARISLIGDEASLPYQRPPLSKRYLSGDVEASRLLLKPQDFYSDNAIELLTGTRVADVDARAKRVTLDSGDTLDFTQLLLATGSEPRRLPLAGASLEGVHMLRRIGDVDAIRAEFAPGKKLLVIGAGYIGLEVAAVAVKAGLDVTVVEAASRVMARSVAPGVSDFYADTHRQAGVDLRLDTALAALHGDRRVSHAETADGERIDCDLVIVGIGIEPCTALAEQAGLAIDNGITVDAGCRTTAPGIFAAGDCTSYPHPWLGRSVRLESVQSAIEQGKTAAASIRGEQQVFDAVPWFWSDQYELKLQIAGVSTGYDQTVVRGKPEDGQFAVFYLASGRVIAIDAVNDPRSFILGRNRLGARPEWPADAIADTSVDLGKLET
jgi:3-phenylpropionate/trans-cinnamate dioxygenase ferredoxin reductase subunit